MSSNITQLLSQYDNTGILEYFKKVNSNFNIRTFPNNENIFLLCNNFKEKYTDDLERECRSVVIEKEIVDDITKLNLIACSHESMIDGSLDDFEYNVEVDVIEELFEGTSVTVFYYGEQWHVCTAKCTDSYKSSFNKNKSYGQMFDECLKNDELTREVFLDSLDRENYYSFLIVHHENQHVTDYTSKFGEKYAFLALGSILKLRSCEEVLGSVQYTYSPMVLTITDPHEKFSGVDGVICKRFDPDRNSSKVFRLLSDKLINVWNKKPNYNNKWHCLVQIFINNDPQYTVRTFMKDYKISDDLVINGKNVDVIGMLAMIYKHVAIILNMLVLYFTTFDHKTNSFTKKKEDKFKKLCIPEHCVLRAIITSLQYGIRSKVIHNNFTIINHLKKNTKAREFIDLLRSLKTLESIDFVTVNNTYFSEYRNLLISLVDKSESDDCHCTIDVTGDDFPELPGAKMNTETMETTSGGTDETINTATTDDSDVNDV